MPFGFRPEFIGEATPLDGDKKPPQRLVEHTHNADIVRDAYNLFLQFRNIAKVRDYLKAVTSRQWDTTKTKRLLTNEAYIGVQSVGDHRNEEGYPIIVPPDLWSRVQEFLTERPQGTRCSRTEDDYVYYLQERVFCPYCNCSYTHCSVRGKSGEKVRYYTCLDTNKRTRLIAR